MHQHLHGTHIFKRTLSTGGAYSLTNDVGTGLFKLEVNTLQSHDIAYYLSVNYQDTGGVWNHKSDIAYLYSRSKSNKFSSFFLQLSHGISPTL